MVGLRLLLAAVIAGFLLSSSESLRFELQSGHTKCIVEDVKNNAMTVGKYSVVNPNEGQPMPDSHKLTVRVTSHHGNNYHYSQLVESGQYAFVAAEEGDYMACFWAPDHRPQTTLTIEFDWKTGVAAKDWSNVAKKGTVDVMELELKKLFDTVTSIHEEMSYLRGREEEMQDLNRTTNSRMATLSLLSLFVCLGVAGESEYTCKSILIRNARLDIPGLGNGYLQLCTISKFFQVPTQFQSRELFLQPLRAGLVLLCFEKKLLLLCCKNKQL